MRAPAPFVLMALCVTSCSDDTSQSASVSVAVASRPDDVTALETLAYACGVGAFEACDELWTLSDVGSEFERLGASCGGRIEVGDKSTYGDCVTRFGAATSTTIPPPTFDVGSPPASSETSSEETVSPPDATIDDLLVTPETGSWIVILVSLAQSTEGSYERALAEAQRISGSEEVDAAVLSTDQFPSLNPGYWVVYLREQYDDADAAAAACADLLTARLAADCYHRQVGEAVAGD